MKESENVFWARPIGVFLMKLKGKRIRGRKMNIHQYLDQGNVIYMQENEVIAFLENKAGVSDFRQILDGFRRQPSKEGMLVRGSNRVTLRLCQPNLFLESPIQNGDRVWVLLGKTLGAYCLI